MYYGDPDGNHVELQVDHFDSVDDLNSSLYGPAFRTNSIGVDFDPEKLCARFDAGESKSEFIRWETVERRDL